MAVYLLHFDSKVSEHAQHYVGFAEDVDARITQHRAGNGARLMAICKERGIDFVVARVWPNGDRTQERRIKNAAHTPRYCPICRAAMKHRMEVVG